MDGVQRWPVSKRTKIIVYSLLQFCVLGSGLLEDRYVGICVFPECQGILLCRLCFRGLAGQAKGAAQLKMRERADRLVRHYPTMIQNLLKFGRGCAALTCGQVGIAA